LNGFFFLAQQQHNLQQQLTLSQLMIRKGWRSSMSLIALQIMALDTFVFGGYAPGPLPSTSGLF
jgi:hypothetical protein